MARFVSDKKVGESPESDRRGFLGKMGVLPAAMIAATSAEGCAEPAAEPAVEPAVESSGMPKIRLGAHSISRLICGTNPFNGGSHLSVFVNRQMKKFFTPEQTLKTLRRCEQVGINCWQAGVGNVALYNRLLDEGSRMKYLAIAAGTSSSVEILSKAGCIGIAHHGETTDRMFKDGQLDKMQDYLKRVRDAGLQVGVSTHMPDVIDAVESKGWDVDYYMACVYERHRSAEALEELLGQAPIPVGEVYLPKDPPRMFRAIQQTKRPCLAFKILAAGRLSERRAWVEQAFRQTFESIKPTDGVIIGIYDEYSDQPAENAAMARKFATNT